MGAHGLVHFINGIHDDYIHFLQRSCRIYGTFNEKGGNVII